MHSRNELAKCGGQLRAALPQYLPAFLAVLIGALLFITFSVEQWRSLQVPSWDLGIFSELAKDYAHFQAPIVPIKGEGFNLLGDHFHPILVLLAPAWWIAPSGLTLLIVQDLLLAISAWPLTRLATRILSPIPATALGLVYVLSWGFQDAVAAQFHEIAFAVPLIAWASVAFVRRRWWACALWIAPTVLVKEDLGLTVFMAGLAIAWRGWAESGRKFRRNKNKTEKTQNLVAHRHPFGLSTTQLGFALAAFGLLAFLITVGLILPALSPTGTWEYGLNSSDSNSVVASTNLLVRLFMPQIKLWTLLILVLTLGIVGLASPWAWLVLPTLAWRFLSTKDLYWDWANWHYNAILMPIAFGALLEVLLRLKRSGVRERTVHWQQISLWRRWVTLLAVATCVVSAVCLTPRLALANLWRSDWGQESSRSRTVTQIEALISPDASVQTDLTLLAYLVPRARVYWVGTVGDLATDYVVVDALSSAWGGNPPQDAAVWASEKTGKTYELIYNQDDFQVAALVK